MKINIEYDDNEDKKYSQWGIWGRFVWGISCQSNDKGNKLRLNNFAYSIRELSRHFLNSLSPEDNIKNCGYVSETTGSGKKKIVSDKPTRRDKIRYAIQGGLSDELLNKLGYDLAEQEDSINSVLDIIKELSRYTHIEPEVFDIDDVT